MRAIIRLLKYRLQRSAPARGSRVQVRVRRAALTPQWGLVADTLTGKQTHRRKRRGLLREQASWF